MKVARLPEIIGITGKAGTGKDTLAAHLRQTYGYSRVAFADPLKSGLMTMLGLSWDYFEHPLKEMPLPSLGKSPRQLMQTIGTEWGRNLVHPDLWLIIAKQRIEMHLLAGEHIVLTDVRFENEAQLVRDLGGVIWHVSRDSAGTQFQHCSEAGVNYAPGVDAVIRNDGTVEDLHAYVDGVLA